MSEVAAPGQHCPFCGQRESDRIELEGRRFLVFPCLFTPEVPPTLGESELAALLTQEYAGRGPKFFQGTCDRLHLYVTKGAGARALGAPVPDPS
ncbi:MAG: hypothetical protein L3J73_02855 [Thermoplasmata archaeon]|nr:hypothetical protein [Thermoplasmata archaeon]